VVDVVELVLVVDVELVVVLLVVVVVVVVVETLGVVVAGVEVSFVSSGTCCWTKGSLLWKLEYRSAGDTMIGCWPVSAREASVVDAPDVWIVPEVVPSSEPPPPKRQPESMRAHPAMRMAPPRRCPYVRILIFVVPYP
jgi:hypothetical protein